MAAAIYWCEYTYIYLHTQEHTHTHMYKPNEVTQTALRASARTPLDIRKCWILGRC